MNDMISIIFITIGVIFNLFGCIGLIFSVVRIF